MSEGWAKAAEEQEAKDLALKVEELTLPPTEGQPEPPPQQPPPQQLPPQQPPPQQPPPQQPPPQQPPPQQPPLQQPPPQQKNAETGESSDEKEASPAELSLMRKALRKGIIENKNNVEIYRKDPNNPLHAVKSFEALNLRQELLKGIYEMGFKLPSKIQEFALPTLLAEPPKNMIAQSQSGTGKTAAFILTLLSRIDPSKKCVQALVLSPTMELALQTLQNAKQMGKYCHDVTMRSAVKGDNIPRGEKITEHIVIGTPGKLVDWTTKFRCLDLRTCKVFVLDEADVMIATQGHQDQSIRIHRQLPKDCQMVLFSATYVDEVVDFATAIIKQPVIVRLKREEETLENIKQMYVECHSSEEKYQAISNIFSIPVGSAMFFCHTKHTAVWLANKLQQDGNQVALLTGDLTPDERVRVLERFRDGFERVLICTNVLARGIDVDSVNLVVNYDLPQHYNSSKADTETYLHRIGRTGRFGKTGNAINIVDGERDLRMLREIEMHFGREITKLDYTNIDEIEKLGED